LNGFPVVSLPIVVSLTVRSPAQARFGKQAFINLALFPQSDFGFENVNFAGQGLRHFSGKALGPERVGDLHSELASSASRPKMKKPTAGFSGVG
jgi:hypothetical protein